MARKPCVTLLLVTILLTACTGRESVASPHPSDTPSQPVTIVFRPLEGSSAGPRDQETALQDLVADFHELHPHIVVQVRHSSLDRGSSIADVAGQVDCFEWIPPEEGSDYQDALYGLAPFVEADLSLSTDDFYPSLVAQFTQQGQLWGLPGHAVPYVIKVNRDLFRAAGIGVPSVDWTTDDLARAARELARGSREQRQYGFVASILEYQELWLLMRQHGAQWVDRSVDPPTVRFDAPDTIEALRWYTNLTVEHDAKPAFITNWVQMADPDWESAGRDRDTLISEGRAAMWTDMESVNLFWEPAGIDVGVLPLPAGPGGAVGAYQTVTGYYISAQAENPQACWQWIVYLSAQPTSSRWVPARRSVLQSDAYREKAGEEWIAAFQASLDGVDKVPFQQIASEEEWLWAGMMIWLLPAYGRTVTGDATPERALADAQRLFDDYRACVVERNVVSDELGWLDCVRDADPSLPDGLFGG